MQSPSIFLNILLILFPSFYSQGQSKFQKNPVNDFPKIISYQFNPTDGLLKAVISGSGKSIEYVFEKLTLNNR
jgi:hypothetical protein